MAQSHASDVHLVRVIQIWVAATSRDEAVSRVLDCVPEVERIVIGPEAQPNEVAVPKLQPGDTRELRK